MHNIERVSDHLRRRMGELEQLDGFRILDLVPTREKRAYLVCDDGQWRTYVYVEGTYSCDSCEGPEQAFEAARAFGWFQAQLQGVDCADMRETIPRFFSTPYRLQQFEDALAEDPMDRAKQAVPEIRFAQTRRAMTTVIEDALRAGRLPTRIVHGDTKLNNVLFDQASHRAACIVDLDTCMPGYSLYDFGDLVRFTAATSAEDETDRSAIGTDLELYRALEAGYREATREFLTADEVQWMPFAARLVTFTIGLRFLADHLAGDRYFKVQREGQNLDRARVSVRNGRLHGAERGQDGAALNGPGCGQLGDGIPAWAGASWAPRIRGARRLRPKSMADTIPPNPEGTTRPGSRTGVLGWFRSLAETRWAVPMVFLLTFADACVSPVLPEVLLIPMVLAAPDKAWRYALVCSIASALGGLFGYWLGFRFWEAGLDEFCYDWLPGCNPSSFATVSKAYGDSTFLGRVHGRVHARSLQAVYLGWPASATRTSTWCPSRRLRSSAARCGSTSKSG